MKAALKLKLYVLTAAHLLAHYNWQAKERTNVIGALYEKMMFTLDYVEQNINSSIFYHCCEHTLTPSLKAKFVIVMDMSEDKARRCLSRAQGESCARVTRFHKNKRIQKLLNRHGHRILWLPPYSPELNPIEKKWAQAKFLRQGWMENTILYLNGSRIWVVSLLLCISITLGNAINTGRIK